jgi:DNA-directed RNA polymerase subunit RPC12/RpoP
MAEDRIYLCTECGNTIPESKVVDRRQGSEGPVLLMPLNVRCGHCLHGSGSSMVRTVVRVQEQ